MRELSDKECDVIIDEARDGCNDGFVRLSYVYVRAGYAAGYRAAQAAMPPREPTLRMVSKGARTCWDHGGEITVSNIWRAMYDAWTQEQTSGAGDKRLPVGRAHEQSGIAAPIAPLDHQNGVQRDAASPGCALGASSLESGNAREATCLSGDPDARQPVAYTAGTVRDHAGSTPAAPTDPIADLCARLRSHYKRGGSFDFALAADALERLALERDKARHSDAHTLAVLKSAERDYLTRIAELRERAERAEAERDTLRAIVRAADELREWAEPDYDSPAILTRLCQDYDRARAKVKL